MTVPDIFDRAARRLRRDRAARDFAQFDFLRAVMLEGIAERLAAVKRAFTDVLDLGCFDGGFAPPPGAQITRLDAGAAFARIAGAIQGEEDQPHFADASFDLVVSAGVFDSVNDLPGALALARRALRPDGLLLAAFVGAGSLATLKAALRDAEGDRPVARIHPQIDVRAAGDLLVRAGFALPVADVESLSVRYADLFGLLQDLRGMAATNVLRDRHPLARATLAAAAHAFAQRADPDGRVPERFEIVFLTGWAPAPSQPQPAKRGSAMASLADALNLQNSVPSADQAAVAFGQHATHRFEQGIHRHRLEQHIVGTSRQALLAQIDRRVGCDDDDRQLRLGVVAPTNVADRGQTIHAGHAQIDQRHREILLVEQLQPGLAALRADHGRAGDIKHVLHDTPIHRIVLDEKHVHRALFLITGIPCR